MNSKPFYTSKTLWFNVLSILAAVITLAISTVGLVPLNWVVFFVFAEGAVNIVLRYVTYAPISGSPGDQIAQADSHALTVDEMALALQTRAAQQKRLTQIAPALAAQQAVIDEKHKAVKAAQDDVAAEEAKYDQIKAGNLDTPALLGPPIQPESSTAVAPTEIGGAP